MRFLAASHVTLGAPCLVALASFAAGPPALAQCPFDSGGPQLPASNQFYGSFLDSDGTRVVVGEGEFYGRRRASVYERVGFDWTLVDVLDGGPVQSSGGAPVAISSSTVMIGNLDTASEAGSVVVHEEIGGAFQQTQVLRPAVPRPDAHFGRRIVMKGDRAVIAAPMDATFEYRGGAVYVFDRVGGMWTETARIDPPIHHPYAFFGLAIDFDGDTIVVGRPGLITYGYPSHSTLVYREVGGTWTLEQEFGGGPSGFGYDVALQGDRLAIGAYRHSVPGVPGGAVFVLDRSGSTWSLAQRLTNDSVQGLVPLPSFGKQVEFDGPRLIVGASAPEIGGSDGVRVLRDIGGTYEAIAAIDPPPGSLAFGASFAYAEGDLWVGAPFTRDPTFVSQGRTGAHFVYDLGQVVAYCEPPFANSTGATGRLEALGCPTLVDNDLVARASDLPPSSVAFAVIGNTTANLPGVLGGLEVLCVGGSIGRFAPASTGAAGSIDVTIDLTAIPRPSGTVSAMAGETWFVQCLYRDAGSSNSTNALSLRVR